MNQKDLQLISWNVRGLNAAARFLAVYETIAATPCHRACLQETKLHTIDQPLAAFLRAYKLTRFAYKPVIGTKGGILLLWNDAKIDVSNIWLGRFSILADVTLGLRMTSFSITGVYDPSKREEKIAFLSHLCSLSLENNDDEKWLIFNDFNLIHRARKKSNRNLNLSLMQRFRQTLEFRGLKEINQQNRKFTWSNERCRPTLVRLDHFFCNQNWDLTFASYGLHALSTSHSDHCPLLLSNQTGPQRVRPFKLENFWPRLPPFQKTVTRSWNARTDHTESFHHLGHKLH
jgi:exonuclease III